jgi:hypothetical protein
MDIIRATKLLVNGVRLEPSYIELTPPQITFKRETDETQFVVTSHISGVEELKPEIKIKGFPGGISAFIGACGTSPLFEVWANYVQDGDCTIADAYVKLQVELLSANLPVMKVGRIDDQMLELGKVLLYRFDLGTSTLFEYDRANDILEINGESYVGSFDGTSEYVEPTPP